MRTFVADGAAYVAHLEAPERAVLLDVVDDVVRLLGPVPEAPSGEGMPHVRLAAASVPAPQDPALHRLLPDASRDAETAAELRRLTEGDVRATKHGHLARLRAGLDAAGPDLVVVPSEAPAVAAALTDVRLVVSERLEIRSDEDSDAVYALVLEPQDEADEGAVSVEEDARRLLATVHVMLGLLQESLVELMLGGLDDAAGLGSPS